MTDEVVLRGTLQFSVDGRVLRELGERLVRRPETALVELIKNSYDADAEHCRVERLRDALIVTDDGTGMNLDQFANAWMRIGTAAKAATDETPRFGRDVTGEKGIGRFSVRFLGERLEMESVADDPSRGARTRLSATFDWPAYDASEDIGEIDVPYELSVVPESTPTGTRLAIGRLRPAAAQLNENHVRTASIGLVSPLRSLMTGRTRRRDRRDRRDPGFQLVLDGPAPGSGDVAEPILASYWLRVRLTVRGRRLSLAVYQAGHAQPEFELSDKVAARCGDLDADIRFFPRRSGMFRDLGVDGRVAYTWIKDNSGVAVFDRDFRVSPYGEAGDDWLALAADAARNTRRPRSPLATKHFAMSDAEQASTADNWMLRLPQPAQLVGVVQVAGTRGSGPRTHEGLIAAADREGFLANDAFTELQNHVRGAVEALAMVDRRLQKRSEETERRHRLQSLQNEAAAAAAAVEQNPNLPPADKRRIVQAITTIASDATAYETATRARILQLETMSLLGVLAGFMTHEFGVALNELDTAHQILTRSVDSTNSADLDLERFTIARKRLSEFTDYATAYIRGSRSTPEKAYPALPRVKHVTKTFAGYAEERGVTVEIAINKSLPAPPVPTSLYDGVVLNLFTNALKAVTAGVDPTNERTITFRAWNEKTTHHLEVADTGVGIPEVLWETVFDPLFTTTESRDDPLGSGMGLGLSLVRASAEAFGGRVRLTSPPPGFSTCVRVQFPLQQEETT